MTLASIALGIYVLVAWAFFAGATRKSDLERARDDAEQARAIGPRAEGRASGETGVA